MTVEGSVRTLTVVDLAGNPGGGTRFVRSLLPAIKRVRPNLAITFVGTESSLGRGDIVPMLHAAGILTRQATWHAAMRWKSLPSWTRLLYKVRRRLGLDPEVLTFINRNFQAEISDSDLTYFPWPYHMPVPKLASPMVATIHDLNFKYFFGAPIFGADAVRALDSDIATWLERAQAVTSSEFMARELAHFYPAHTATVPVIRLAPFTRKPDDVKESNGVEGPAVREPFILCPTQVTIHKNLGVLIAAQALLRARFPDLQLVVTGLGSDMATGRSSSIGSVRDDTEPDVIGLGYISNDNIDWLIERAAVVVNPSLYEAGNGPGIDAWSRGTPVAMSDIPSFREHVDAFGVHAALFDPRDPGDVAAKIGDILEHPAKWAANAESSRASINARSWDDVAADYLAVFDATHARGQR